MSNPEFQEIDERARKIRAWLRPKTPCKPDQILQEIVKRAKEAGVPDGSYTPEKFEFGIERSYYLWDDLTDVRFEYRRNTRDGGSVIAVEYPSASHDGELVSYQCDNISQALGVYLFAVSLVRSIKKDIASVI